MAGAMSLLSSKLSVAKSAPERFDIHQASRNSRLGALGVRRPHLSGTPPDHKSYPGKWRISLLEPVVESARTLTEIVRQWSPDQNFGGGSMTLAQLVRHSHLLA